ncbi:DUF6551 family protein [Martelella mangrovi]|uniref:ParB/Sulfiredoxin domain-containing protein n=1 Tax=Martelella mangrovi TaxID=1397477 RepID=A0ABV2IEJ3_9HYPH
MTEKFNPDIGQKPELLWVPVDKIIVDNNYQREIKPRRVTQILREFDWSKFQPVNLAEQADGNYAVFDGQHRVAAARAHPHVNEVPAAVVRLSDKREEAGAFLGVNMNRTAVMPVERYYAGLEAGEAGMMQICAVLEEAGCEIVPYPGAPLKANRTNAVSSVQRAIKYYGEGATTAACRTISQAWPSDANALKGIFISALSMIFHKNKEAISAERMKTVLSDLDRRSLSTAAETIKKLSGGSAPTALARAICETYNRGLSKNQISIAGPQ